MNPAIEQLDLSTKQTLVDLLMEVQVPTRTCWMHWKNSKAA